MKRLEGKVAIVTGAARGQGEATARMFHSEGAKVAIVDVLEQEGAAVAQSLGEGAIFEAMDIGDEPAWQRLLAKLTETWGGVDILINNAAICPAAAIADMEVDMLRQVLDVNLVGSFLGMKTIGGAMAKRGRGSIVNVHSTGALWGINGLGAYSASKWGLRGLSKTAAMEFGHLGVRINAIFPGGIASPMAGVDGIPRDEVNARFVIQPIARIGEPEEVAAASLFLASDEASYICGAELTIDGGMTSGRYEDFLPGAPDALKV